MSYPDNFTKTNYDGRDEFFHERCEDAAIVCKIGHLIESIQIECEALGSFTPDYILASAHERITKMKYIAGGITNPKVYSIICEIINEWCVDFECTDYAEVEKFTTNSKAVWGDLNLELLSGDFDGDYQ